MADGRVANRSGWTVLPCHDSARRRNRSSPLVLTHEVTSNPSAVPWPLALITLGLLVVLVTLGSDASLARAYRHWSLTIGGGLAALGLVLGLISAAMAGEVVRVAFHIVDLSLLGLIVLVSRRSRAAT